MKRACTQHPPPSVAATGKHRTVRNGNDGAPAGPRQPLEAAPPSSPTTGGPSLRCPWPGRIRSPEKDPADWFDGTPGGPDLRCGPPPRARRLLRSGSISAGAYGGVAPESRTGLAAATHAAVACSECGTTYSARTPRWSMMPESLSRLGNTAGTGPPRQPCIESVRHVPMCTLDKLTQVNAGRVRRCLSCWARTAGCCRRAPAACAALRAGRGARWSLLFI